jgi:SNF2 family DNA or RNA helicase
MSLEERDVSVETFKKDVDVLLIQIDTGGQGYNFQCATKIFISSPSWNPAQEYQAIGRAHRTGQMKKVTVYRMVIDEEDSIEESMIQLHDKKRKIIADILNDNRIIKSISYREIVRLFKK